MLLDIKGVGKRFGGLQALSEITMGVEEGEILGIMGKNGAGKTTLFNIVAGAFPADKGSIVFDGVDVTRASAHQRARLGIARTFQIPQPLSGLTVLENVVVGALMRAESLAAAEPVAYAVLERMGLAAKARESARRLTLPELKRLEIARALATRPRVILLDEMMSGLRHHEIAAALDLVREVRDGGVTVLFIEHVISAVMELCDRVVVIDRGTVLMQGRPQEVTRDRRVIETYLGGGVAA